MKQPKFKFELVISETTTLRQGYKVDASGSLIPDARFSCSDYIQKSGFILSEDLYGLHVTISKYEIVGPTKVFIEQADYTSFGPFHNTGYQFDEEGQCAVVSVEHTDIWYKNVYQTVNVDPYNFLAYKHLTHPAFSHLKKVYERESSEMYLRAKLQGDIHFMAGTFDKLASLNMNNSVILNIYKKNTQTGNYDTYYSTQRFTKADCTFDYDKRQVSPGLAPNDQYTRVLAAMNTEYDLQKLNSNWCSAKYKIPPLKQFYVYGAGQVTNVIGESFFNTDVEFPDPEEGQTYFHVLRLHNFARAAFYTELRYHQILPELTDGRFYDFSFHVSSTYDYPGAAYPYGLVPHTYAFGPSYIPYKLHFNSVTGRVEIQEYNSGAIIATSDVTTATSLIAHILEGLRFYKDGRVIGVITAVIDYDVFQRTLYHADEPVDSTDPYALLSDEDFAYSGSVYNYAESSFAFMPRVLVTADMSDKPGEFGITKSPVNYFTNSALSHGGLHERFMPVCAESWSGISLWCSGSINYNNLIDTFGYDFTNKRCVTVISAIRTILGVIAPQVQLADTAQHSEFLYGLFNPLGLPDITPILTHSSNITAGAYNQPAQRGTVKLKDLFDLLKNAMQLYWYIDDNNVMHIEHVSWFLKGGTYGQKVAQLDITSAKDAFNRKVFDTGHGTIKYDTNALYSRFTLAADEDTTDASAEVSMDVYDGLNYDKGPQDISLGSFRVNLDYLFATGSADSHEDNFAFILAHHESGSNTIGLYSIPRITYSNPDMICDCGEQYNMRPLNTYAMPRFLVNYYMQNFAGRDLSLKAYTPQELTPVRRQTISIPAEIDIQPYGFIMTRFGKGLIDKISTDLDSQYATIELLHSTRDYAWPYEDNPAGTTAEFDLLKNGTNNVEDGQFVYIDNGDTFYPLYTLPTLANYLLTHPEGITIEASCILHAPTANQPESIILASTIPTAASPRSIFFIGSASYSYSLWHINAGLALCDFASHTYTMQNEHCSLAVFPDTEFGIKFKMQLVGANIRTQIWIAADADSANFTGLIPFSSRISENVNPITVATILQNSFLRFKNFKIVKR